MCVIFTIRVAFNQTFILWFSSKYSSGTGHVRSRAMITDNITKRMTLDSHVCIFEGGEANCVMAWPNFASSHSAFKMTCIHSAV